MDSSFNLLFCLDTFLSPSLDFEILVHREHVLLNLQIPNAWHNDSIL